MNFWKPIAVCSVAIFAIAVGCTPAAAPSGGPCGNQPNMAHAAEDLRAARAYLERAEHDKGGWRGRAIESTDIALRETERGCAFADTH